MKERGFTLLEVLVATMIMAIAVTGLLSSLSTSLRNAARLTDYDRAAMLAHQKMDQFLLLPKMPSGVWAEGKFDPAETGGVEAGWKARATIFETPPMPAPGAQALDRIELQIWWKAGDVVKTYAVETYRTTLLTPADMDTLGAAQ